MHKIEDLKNISTKIVDEIENTGLFREFYEFWDSLDYEEKREQTKCKKKILATIHKMHNSLYAIEQMIEEIK